MTIEKLICHLDGTQELVSCEVPETWATLPADAVRGTADSSEKAAE